jgi:hypothetical protein
MTTTGQDTFTNSDTHPPDSNGVTSSFSDHQQNILISILYINILYQFQFIFKRSSTNILSDTKLLETHKNLTSTHVFCLHRFNFRGDHRTASDVGLMSTTPPRGKSKPASSLPFKSAKKSPKKKPITSIRITEESFSQKRKMAYMLRPDFELIWIDATPGNDGYGQKLYSMIILVEPMELPMEHCVIWSRLFYTLTSQRMISRK